MDNKKKLLIVTFISHYEKKVLQFFKEANIESFSGTHIEGFKNVPTLQANSSWFPSEKSGANSIMFFSFTQDENIDMFFTLVTQFNDNLKINSPIHAVVAPIERSI